MKEEARDIRRPLLIALSMWFSGVGIPLGCIVLLISMNAPSVVINGVPRGHAYSMRYGLWQEVFLIGLLAFLYITLRSGRPWFQHIPATLQVVTSIAAVFLRPKDITPTILLQWGAALAITIWYFYFKPNVRSYFADLRHRASANQTLQPTDHAAFRPYRD